MLSRKSASPRCVVFESYSPNVKKIDYINVCDRLLQIQKLYLQINDANIFRRKLSS